MGGVVVVSAVSAATPAAVVSTAPSPSTFGLGGGRRGFLRQALLTGCWCCGGGRLLTRVRSRGEGSHDLPGDLGMHALFHNYFGVVLIRV